MTYVIGPDNVPVLDLATLQARYQAANDAYDKLMGGATVVEVTANGYSVRYQRNDADKLLGYIQQLAAQIRSRRNGAVGFVL